MAKLFNRAKMTTATTGSGTVTLGSASNGFQTFAAAGVSNGDVVQYVIEEGANFEIGVGSYSSTGTSLTRSPTESSNSNAAITLAGQATVSITAVADDLNRLQHGGSDKVTVSSTGASVTGNLAVSGTVDGRDVASDGSKLDGIEANAKNDQTITAGDGLTGGGTGDVTISHSDTSSQASVNGSGRTYIQDITLDTYGHVTGLATATETVVNTDTNTIPNNATITLSAGNALTGGGNFTTDQSSNETITFNHSDTSSQSSVNNSGRTYIQDITLDGYGHVTGINSATETVTNTNTNQLTTFQVEDGDGTEVTISHGKEWKFTEAGGININWTDTSTGSDGDPFDLSFNVSTSITAGGGLTGGGALSSNRTISHADTSSQASINNSSGTVIQDVTLDGYGHVTGLASVNLDGRYYTESESDTRFLRGNASDTMSGNLTVDNGTSTTLSVKCDNGGNAIVRAGGDGQGTGVFEVTQDGGSHGGGISYNGDGSPAFAAGESADHVTFYRIAAGTRTEVFHYPYSSNTVNFNATPTAGGTSLAKTTDIGNGTLTVQGTGALGGSGTFTANQSGNTTISISHDDTSSQGSVNNSGNTVIQDVTLDTYGHVTGLTSKSLSIPSAANNATITLSAGTGLSGGGNFTTNQSSNETITFNLEAPYTYIDTATGNFGTVKVDDDRGVTWAGYAIRDDWVFMAQGANEAGVYNDTDNEWAIKFIRNAQTQLYHNGTLRLETSSNGIEMSGRIDMNNNDIYGCDQLFHHGDTNTYMQFHAADQWRVVVGGSERLEVKNSSPHVLVSGDLNSTSDERLKKNIKPIDNALADICQLEGVTFDWKDTGTQGQGFIAQQVEPIIPDVVNTDEDTGMKSINYVGLIGHLVEAIKTQQTQIDDLKAEIQSMKS